MEVLLLHAELLPLLQRDFWSYASLILDVAAKRDLEDACRAAGAALPSRLPVGGSAEAAGMTSLIETAHRACGGEFVRHAGYFGGANAGRTAEANVRSPNDGARRLIGELTRECGSLHFEIAVPSQGRCVVSVIGLRPIGPALTAYAEGFVKGAAMRLNEGLVPTIQERTAQGGKVWSATLDWGAPAPARGPATGGRRKQHK